MATKHVSYIFPIFNEAENIDVLYRTLCDVIRPATQQYTFEFVFVNDGSRDNSLEKLVDLHHKDPRVVVVNFSRNFGHQLAVTAGLDHASGEAIIIMDSDMQDPPKVSLELLKKWEEGFDVVYAQRRSRKDSFFKKLTAQWFYITLEKLADIKIPRNTGDFRLIDRKVATALSSFKEHDRFLRGLVSYIGFRQTAVQFDRDERHAGETGYPLKKMLKFAADGILGFSSAPLKFITKVGYFFSALSVIGILYALYMRLFRPQDTVEGWTLLIITILLIGGVQLIMLGVVGGYIGRIYTEVQGRPLYIVDAVYADRKREKKQ